MDLATLLYKTRHTSTPLKYGKLYTTNHEKYVFSRKGYRLLSHTIKPNEIMMFLKKETVKIQMSFDIALGMVTQEYRTYFLCKNNIIYFPFSSINDMPSLIEL